MSFQRERFEEAISIINALPERRLNMDKWLEKEKGCGTVGCVCGHYAAAHPELFKIEKDGIFSLKGEGAVDLVWPRAMYFDDWGTHFGIAYTEAIHLFSPSSYENDPEYDGDSRATKEEVLDRLREFLKMKTKGALV